MILLSKKNMGEVQKEGHRALLNLGKDSTYGVRGLARTNDIWVCIFLRWPSRKV